MATNEIQNGCGLSIDAALASNQKRRCVNTGLCVITTRTPVADIADHERTSALRRDLEQLSSDAGAKLLRALGVKGHEPELQSGESPPSWHRAER